MPDRDTGGHGRQIRLGRIVIKPQEHSTPLFSRRNCLTLVLLALVTCAWLTPIDNTAAQLTDNGLKRALVSFASARALNALISVAQETEIAIEPAGVGVTLAPGQVLDPLNDLVERFGDLMLAASIAFGVQKLLIAVGASSGISLLLSVIAGAVVILLWRGKAQPEQAVPAWTLRLLTALIVVRFALPVVTIGNEMLFKAFLEQDYKQGQAAVTLWTDKAENMAAAPPAKQNTSTYENFKAWLAQNVNIRERLDKFRVSAEETTEHVIKLMAIFLVQTLIAPLAFLWLLMRCARQLLDPRQWGKPERI
jgi:hypothetical protein